MNVAITTITVVVAAALWAAGAVSEAAQPAAVKAIAPPAVARVQTVPSLAGELNAIRLAGQQAQKQIRQDALAQSARELKQLAWLPEAPSDWRLAGSAERPQLAVK